MKTRSLSSWLNFTQKNETPFKKGLLFFMSIYF